MRVNIFKRSKILRAASQSLTKQSPALQLENMMESILRFTYTDRLFLLTSTEVKSNGLGAWFWEVMGISKWTWSLCENHRHIQLGATTRKRCRRCCRTCLRICLDTRMHHGSTSLGCERTKFATINSRICEGRPSMLWQRYLPNAGNCIYYMFAQQWLL